VPVAVESATVTLRDYARTVWMRKWIVLALAIIGAATGFVSASLRTDLYTATAILMYVQPTDISDPTSSSSSVNLDAIDVQIQSVVNTIDTPAVAASAEKTLSSEDAALEYTVTAKAILPTDTTGGNTVAELVGVSAETVDATAAAHIANAYAKTIIQLRKATQVARYKAAEKVVEDQLKLFTTPASKLTTDYAVLAQQLRKLQIAAATATGDFEIVTPATTPTSPSSPHPVRDGALGLLIGLVLGVALALVIAQFDPRVRSHREVSALLGLPILGRIPAIAQKTLQESPLFAATTPNAPASEALRMLRANLEWASIDDPLRSILVTSCTKGEGKTFTTCNLGVTLARAGKRVIVVDADLRDPRVHRVFNVPNSVGVTSVILGQTALQKAVQVFELDRGLAKRPALKPALARNDANDRGQHEGSLLLLTSGPLPPDPGEVIASRKFSTWLRDLGSLPADYILVDAPPVLSVGDAGAMAPSVDALLVVVSLQEARRPLLNDGKESLDQVPCRKIGIVTVGEQMESGEYYRYARQQ